MKANHALGRVSARCRSRTDARTLPTAEWIRQQNEGAAAGRLDAHFDGGRGLLRARDRAIWAAHMRPTARDLLRAQHALALELRDLVGADAEPRAQHLGAVLAQARGGLDAHGLA